jgi:hypothetical protein
LYYYLVLVDTAMRRFPILEHRPKEELVWLVALLHKELGLGI